MKVNNMKNLTSFFALFLILFLSIATMAQTNFWQKINCPFGDTGNTVAINATGTVFLATNHGVFRSTDNGINWSNVDSNLSVIRFAFNSIGDILFAVEYGSVFRSTDDGTNWTKIYDHQPIKTIAINDSGYIFLGWGHENGGGVERSTDNGASWINTGLEANSYSIVINASGTIFSGGFYSNSACIFRSTDNGVSWINTNAFTFFYPVTELAINNAGHIFAGTSSNGAYRSTDIGEHWTQMGLTTAFITALAINTSGHIFTGTYGEGVYRSTDDGANWTAINSGLNNDSVVSIAINPSGTIFTVTESGLFRSVQSTTSVRELSADAPGSFELNQNYPNPFNPSTTISFSIPTSEFVTLKVFDVLGSEVATLVNEEKQNGVYEVDFSASNLPSGVYLYKLQAGNFIETKKLMLLK
jgi:photosystem II stability/assembly factor-like uncharacterized protein